MDAHLAIPADKAWHLVLPITVLTMLGVGGVEIHRTNMLEVLNSDYIERRGQGLSSIR